MKKNNAKGQVKPKSPAKVRREADSPDFSDIIKYFDILKENDEPLFQVLDMFPIPIEIFAADGTAVYANLAHLDLNNIKDRSTFIGKYNALKDTVCLDQMGYREEFERAFSREKVIIKNFPAPIDDLVERGVVKEKPYEKAILDIYTYPVWKDDKLIFVVAVFVVRSLYLGRPDVAKAKEYMDRHWRGEYAPEKVAKSVNMSVSQLYKLFKEHTGMTPGDYHKKIKVEHIKGKLLDKHLSIKEAFSACGEDSRGWMLKVFKEVTGVNPTQFRKKNR